MKVNVDTECWRRRWLMVFLTRGLFVPSIRPQCRPVGGRAEGAGSYSRDDRHKRETGIPVRVAMCEAVVLKEMIEFGAPGGRVERDEGSRQKRAGTGARSSQRCKIRGVVEFVLLGSARIWGPLLFGAVRVRSEPAVDWAYPTKPGRYSGAQVPMIMGRPACRVLEFSASTCSLPVLNLDHTLIYLMYASLPS